MRSCDAEVFEQFGLLTTKTVGWIVREHKDAQSRCGNEVQLSCPFEMSCALAEQISAICGNRDDTYSQMWSAGTGKRYANGEHSRSSEATGVVSERDWFWFEPGRGDVCEHSLASKGRRRRQLALYLTGSGGPKGAEAVKAIADRQLAETANAVFALAPYARDVLQDLLRAACTGPSEGGAVGA